jgi:uncharacterized protein YcaQ
MKANIDLAGARRIAAAASGLGAAGSGMEASLGAIQRLGAVQIDTISVVERAHHHILWSRSSAYSPDDISRLEADPRRIIEYWSHAASYIPIEDYRFCIPRMERVKANGHDWFKTDPSAVAFVLDRIKAEGPLRAQDFESRSRKGAGWWDWKPAKVALEYLFHAGELISVTRRGFQKVYDLASRSLPSELDMRPPTAEEMAAHYLDRAVAGLGVFAEDDIAYMRRDCTEGIAAELEARLEAGSLLELDIEQPGSPGEKTRKKRWFAAPSALEPGKGAEPRFPGRSSCRAFVLSPFDPLIIDRRRAARLFGLEYQLECYVPEAKRKFGYFALPILFWEKDARLEFVGLADLKADRRARSLIVRRISLSRPPKGPPAARIARAVADELQRFASFNGAEKLVVEGEGIGDPKISAAFMERLARRA